jgi:hypothetical protein
MERIIFRPIPRVFYNADEPIFTKLLILMMA